MNEIKNIIFDFGGVIIDIDFQRSIDAFISMGAANFDKHYSQEKQIHIFNDLDKGHITEQKFCAQILQFLPKNITHQQIIEAWNAILIGIPAYRIRLLEKIKTKYRIFLLSNTNAIHYPVYTKELQDKYQINNLSDIFEKVYLSFEYGERKPDSAFYEIVLRENRLHPSETLFIDDSKSNIPPAILLGMSGLFLKPPMEIQQIFDTDSGLLKNAYFHLFKDKLKV